MLEIYCDSSYNDSEDSFIGCVVMRDGELVHQSTTKVPSSPENNLDCELAALNFAISLCRIFSKPQEEVVIYNDSTEAVKVFQAREPEFNGILSAGAGFRFEYTPREEAHQSIADSLSKKFPIFFRDALTFDVECLSKRPEVLFDIVASESSVFYLEKVKEMSTNTKICYRLVVRSAEKILSDDRLYLVKKGGFGTQVTAAEEIRKDLSDPQIRASMEAKGICFENSYFLLTDETWGLRLSDNKAYSLLPFTVPHRIICDEVYRSADSLFRRLERFK